MLKHKFDFVETNNDNCKYTEICMPWSECVQTGSDYSFNYAWKRKRLRN